MAEIKLDLLKPYYLVEIYDASNDDLKYLWSTDRFSEQGGVKLGGGVVGKSANGLSDSYVLDIYIDSRLDPPANNCEIAILERVENKIQIGLGDTVKVYLGYYKKLHFPEPVCSLAYTGRITEEETEITEITIHCASDLQRITAIAVEQSFSKVMTINEIIKKLVTQYGKLCLAKKGIAKTSISKQKGYAISKQVSIFEHIRQLADYAGFDLYMDVNNCFNAKPWSPKTLKEPRPNDDVNRIATQAWLPDRTGTEDDFTNQYLHEFQIGLNIIDLQLHCSTPESNEIEVMNLFEYTITGETNTLTPPKSKLGRGGWKNNFQIGKGDILKNSNGCVIVSHISKGDLQKIAVNIFHKLNTGITGKLEVIGTPQVRLGDGVKLGGAPFSDSLPDDCLFQVTSVEHVFNMDDGFISRIGIKEYVPKTSKSGLTGDELMRKSGIVKLF